MLLFAIGVVVGIVGTLCVLGGLAITQALTDSHREMFGLD